MRLPIQPMLRLPDHAAWRCGPAINQLLADHDPWPLPDVPPACPVLTPQEHIWAQARQAVGHHHHFTCLATLTEAYDAYLNDTPFGICLMDRDAPPTLCEV